MKRTDQRKRNTKEESTRLPLSSARQRILGAKEMTEAELVPLRIQAEPLPSRPPRPSAAGPAQGSLSPWTVEEALSSRGSKSLGLLHTGPCPWGKWEFFSQRLGPADRH